jgi:TonB-dependent receptor
MRILFFLLIVLLRSVSIQAQADPGKKITIQFPEQSLAQCLKQLTAVSGSSFAYDEKEMEGISKRAMTFTDAPLHSVLAELLKGTDFGYKELNGSFVISRKRKPVKQAPQEQHTVSTLRGRIVDFETYQPLPGASVTLKETGKSVLSDEKGYYAFPAVGEGIYTLLVTYVGYQQYQSEGITVAAGKAVENDIKMQAGKYLNEVVVTSGKRKVKAVTHTTEKELIVEIRNATGVLSGISSELISKTGDRNAAEVVRRIPGITVTDNRFIVVRGMNERYNLTYLNDNIAPATELYSKAFAYDLLPSSIIDRVIAYKSPRADLNGEFVGAAIKVYTRNAMPVKHFDVGVQLAHRPGSTMTDIISYKGGKLDWLGIDDGTRKLPSFSPGYFQSNKSAGNLSQAAMLKEFSPTLGYLQTRSTPDMQVYFNYYDSYRIGTKTRLYNLTSVTYTKETTSYTIHRQTGNTDAMGADTAVDQEAIKKNSIMDSRQSTEIGKINALENLTLKLNDRNSLQLKNFIINEGRQFTGVNDSRANALSRYDVLGARKKDIILSFQHRFLYSGNLGGTHKWGDSSAHQLTWNLGYSRDIQNVPDQRISHFWSRRDRNDYWGEPTDLAYVIRGSNTEETYDGMIARLFVKNSESIYNASVDYSFRISPSFKISAGTYQMFKNRQVGRRFFRVNRGGMDKNGLDDAIIGSAIANGWTVGYGWNNPNTLDFRLQDLGRLWNPANFSEDNSGLGLYDATSPVDAYVASEQNNAFYGMGDWKTRDERLTINGGLRVEYDRQKIAGAIIPVPGGSLNVIYGDHPKTELLPSLNLTWRPNQLWVLRGAYGRSVNRPEFRELTPYRDVDFSTNEMMTGNPQLVSASVNNFDIRAELYPKNAANNEMINIGVFYKKLRNPIERLRAEPSGYDQGPYTYITFANAYSAEVYGLEAEIKKSLSFIGGRLFRRISIVVNGTLTKSSTRQYDISLLGGIHKDSVLDGRPLQGQAPYVLNGGLFYEHPGTGTKMGVSYNVNGPVIYAKSTVNPQSPSQRRDINGLLSTRPDLLRLPLHQLDFSITQRIIRSLQMKFTMQNILDQSYRIAEDHNYNQRYDPEYPVINPYSKEKYYNGDNLQTQYKPGRYFLMSFTYAF